MMAMGFLIYPAFEVVITGALADEDTQEMVRSIRQQYLPNAVMLLRPPDNAAASEIIGIAPFTKDLNPVQDRATAYVCRNFTCHRPTTDVHEMLRFLNIEISDKDSQ
jgi:hypothetical protein